MSMVMVMSVTKTLLHDDDDNDDDDDDDDKEASAYVRTNLSSGTLIGREKHPYALSTYHWHRFVVDGRTRRSGSSAGNSRSGFAGNSSGGDSPRNSSSRDPTRHRPFRPWLMLLLPPMPLLKLLLPRRESPRRFCVESARRSPVISSDSWLRRDSSERM